MSIKAMRLVSIAALAAISINAANAQEAQRCPHQLYATGFDGEPLGGSKQALIDAVQRGEPIRVGWDIDFDDDGAADLSHWTDASYLSIWEGEVFTQVDAIHRQRPVRGEGDMRLPDDYSEWRASLGTTGEMQGAFSNGDKSPAMSVRIFWCAATPPEPVWTAVFKNGLNGETLEGSKDDLFAAIRAGQPIQIGWGLERQIDGERRSVEHVASPVFLGIADGEHVTAQLSEHIAPRSYWDVDQALFDDAAVMWRGLMTTRGTFDAVWANRATGEVVRRSPQRAVMTWYVRSPAPVSTPSLAVPNGVVSDQRRAAERFPQ